MARPFMAKEKAKSNGREDGGRGFKPRPFAPPKAVQRSCCGEAAETSPLQTYLQRLGVQAKLTLGPVDDPYEREADHVAQQVVGDISQAPASQARDGGVQRMDGLGDEELQAKRIQRMDDLNEDELMTKRIQRMDELDEDELMTKRIQRADELDEDELMAKRIQREGLQENAPVDSGIEASIEGARGGGAALPDDLRGGMERAFGANFGGVRVHADSSSHELNQSLQARAFTTGQDIFFRQGEYEPASRSGQELIAHELTHVIQQGGGRREE